MLWCFAELTNDSIITNDSTEVCGGVSVYRDTALSLYYLVFYLNCCARDISGLQSWPMIVLPSANNNAVQLRAGLYRLCLKLWKLFLSRHKQFSNVAIAIDCIL